MENSDNDINIGDIPLNNRCRTYLHVWCASLMWRMSNAWI